MDLYLIRHAEAVPSGDPNYVEDERPLTVTGHDQARALAAALRAHGVRFDRIVTSPLPRARQTAEELVPGLLDPNEALKEYAALAPGGRRRKLDRLLLGMEADTVALVGHEPDLGAYAARLIGSKKGQVKIAKAGVAVIHFDGPPGKKSGTLTALLTPEWLGWQSGAPAQEGPPVHGVVG